MLAVVGGLVVLIVFMAAGAAGVVTTVLGGSHQIRCTVAGDETPALSGYTSEQLANATTIITVGEQLNVPNILRGRSLINPAIYFPACANGSRRAKHGANRPFSTARFDTASSPSAMTAAAASRFSCLTT